MKFLPRTNFQAVCQMEPSSLHHLLIIKHPILGKLDLISGTGFSFLNQSFLLHKDYDFFKVLQCSFRLFKSIKI